MKAHIVLAHPEPQSFNAGLAALAKKTLEDRKWAVSLSDLYAMEFDPCERAAHFRERVDEARFDAQLEQRSASENGTLPSDIQTEIERLDSADVLILQYPMWWHLQPAMLKGWFDRVLVFGKIYSRDCRFDKGYFVGKRAMLSVTVGSSSDTYSYNGRSGDIDMLLWPIHFSLAYIGFSVLQPYIAYGVEGGLKYSEPLEVSDRLKEIRAGYVSRLRGIENDPAMPFNGMDDWGPNGRIKASARAYSPFIRHRENLELD